MIHRDYVYQHNLQMLCSDTQSEFVLLLPLISSEHEIEQDLFIYISVINDLKPRYRSTKYTAAQCVISVTRIKQKY